MPKAHTKADNGSSPVKPAVGLLHTQETRAVVFTDAHGNRKMLSLIYEDVSDLFFIFRLKSCVAKTTWYLTTFYPVIGCVYPQFYQGKDLIVMN